MASSAPPESYKSFDEWVEHQERKLGIGDEDERETNPFAETYVPGWQHTAERVVQRFRKGRGDLQRRLPFSDFSMAFKDPKAERMFEHYFAMMFALKIRRYLLLLNFAYMVYATTESHTSTQWTGAQMKYIVWMRASYILINMAVFGLSYIKRSLYSQHLMKFSSVLSLLTSIMITLEGYLLGQIDSPYMIIVLIVYLVATNVLVTTRFVASCVNLAATIAVYNALTLIDKHGEIRTHLHILVTYNAILLSFGVLLLIVNRRTETEARLSFTHYSEALREADESEFASSSRVSASASASASNSVVNERTALVGARGGLRRRNGGAPAGFAADEDDELSRPLAFLRNFMPAESHQHGMEEVIKNSGAKNLSQLLRALEDHEDRTRAPAIVDARHLPQYYHSYNYIKSGYRTGFTPKMCLQSLLTWHNETLNVWTELVPCVSFFLLWFFVIRVDSVFLRAGWMDYLVVNIGLLGGLVLRPLCSGAAHLFYCMNQRAFYLWWSIDYISILVSMLCISLAVGRFTFYCLESQQTFYFVSVVGLFISTVISVVFVASPGVRTSSFLLYVLFANGVPLTFQITLGANHDSDFSVPWAYMGWWICMLGLSGTGLLVKSVSIPERFAPGRFDIVASSHQIWHILINSAMLCAYFMYRSYLQWRLDQPCHVVSS